MITKTYIFILLVFFSLLGCKKDSLIPPEKEKGLTPKENSPPQAFIIRVLNKSYNYAVIEWESAIDPDMDTLYYTVYLNDLIIAKNLTIDTILRIDNLKPEKLYNGKIEVTDRKAEVVTVNFSFQTEKYFLKFNKLFSIENGSSAGYSIEKTSDGGYIIGSEAVINDFGHSLCILKLDSLGFEQWHSTCTDHVSDYVRIKQTRDNGYILVDNAKIIKLDQNGKELWRYPADPVKYEYCSVIQTEGNNYMTVRSFSATRTSVSKFNENGVLIWEKIYGTLNRSKATYIEKSMDGNYVVLGTEGISESRENFFVLKINDEGDILWRKTYIDKAYAFARQIKPTGDNGFIFCGTSVGNRQIEESRVIKIDYEGNLLWDKSFLWDSFKTYAYSIAQTKDGGYIFSGGNGYSPMSALLVKLDQGGEVVWKKTYKPTDYMDYIWIGCDVKPTDDNGIIMTGGKGSVWGNGPKENGLWVIKTDAAGNY
ncbi:MAG: hypothetical protein ACM3RX_01640 [Methanococcaceae archaeon]